jgi:Protein of unknown function (DUF4199)
MLKFFSGLNPLIRVPIRYGILGGILGFVLIVILYYIGRHPFMIGVVLDFRIALFGVFMFFILKEIRDYHFGGLLFFWQGLIATAIFTVVFAVIASGLIWIFGINVPGFVIKYVELATNQLKSMPPEALKEIGQSTYDGIARAIKEVDAFYLAKRYFGQCYLISLFVSIILSVILRRQPQIQP